MVISSRRECSDWLVGGGYVMKFFKRNFFECRHAVTSSLRLFRVASSGLHIMKYFSHKHRLHLLLIGVKDWACFRIFHVML